MGNIMSVTYPWRHIKSKHIANIVFASVFLVGIKFWTCAKFVCSTKNCLWLLKPFVNSCNFERTATKNQHSGRTSQTFAAQWAVTTNRGYKGLDIWASWIKYCIQNDSAFPQWVTESRCTSWVVESWQIDLLLQIHSVYNYRIINIQYTMHHTSPQNTTEDINCRYFCNVLFMVLVTRQQHTKMMSWNLQQARPRMVWPHVSCAWARKLHLNTP